MARTQVPGRTSEGRAVAGVGTTNISAALTGPAGAFHEEDVGRTIVHANLPGGATIAAVASDTAATASANATATGSATATFGAASATTYGFIGWSPETDTESEMYTIAGGAGASAPSRIMSPTQENEQRYR